MRDVDGNLPVGDAELEKRAREILAKPYSRLLVADPNGGFSAKILEFPGCFSEGDTAEAAAKNLEEAAVWWLVSLMSMDGTVPGPTGLEASYDRAAQGGWLVYSRHYYSDRGPYIVERPQQGIVCDEPGATKHVAELLLFMSGCEATADADDDD